MMTLRIGNLNYGRGNVSHDVTFILNFMKIRRLDWKWLEGTLARTDLAIYLFIFIPEEYINGRLIKKNEVTCFITRFKISVVMQTGKW